MKQIQFTVVNDEEAAFYADLVNNLLAVYRVFRAPLEPLEVKVVDIQPQEKTS